MSKFQKDKSTIILGFPTYYVWTDPDDNIDKIWRFREAIIELEKDEINREIIANKNGNVALINDKGVPIPMKYQEIIDQVVLARKELRAKSGDGRDPTLIRKREQLQSEYNRLLKLCKDTVTLAELVPHKEAYFAAEDALKEFDKMYPDYIPKRGKQPDYQARVLWDNLQASERSLWVGIEEYIKEFWTDKGFSREAGLSILGIWDKVEPNYGQ